MEENTLPSVSNSSAEAMVTTVTQPSVDVGTNSEHAQTVTPANADGTATSTTSTSGTSNVTNQYVPPSEDQYKAITGKISALERKSNEIEKTRYSDYARMLASQDGLRYLDERFSQDRNSFNWFREMHKKSTGQDIGSWEALYGNVAPLNQNQQGQQVNTHVDTDRIIEEKVSRVLDQNRAFDDFLAQRKDQFEPIYGDPERGGEKLITKIVRLATALAEDYPDMSLSQRLTHAFDTLPEIVQMRINSAREDGQLIGKATAYASNNGVNDTIQSSSTTSRTSTNIVGQLNQWQQQRYNLFLQSKGKDFADKWAQMVIQERN